MAEPQVSPASNLSAPLFVEVFAGRANFSRAMQQAGFRVLSIDHELHDPVMPIVQLDLTSSSGQQIFWDVMQQPQVIACHLGLPCGTSSLARERPIPQALRDQGVPCPPPLRSAEFPLGLPTLRDHHRVKVEAANCLYRLALDVILFCEERNIVISIENPANSWLWAILILLSRDHSPRAARAFNKLCKILFHACCHGSGRRKHTAWLSTDGVFTALEAQCQNDHDHEPWGIRWRNGAWVFDTSTEAAYPKLLAQRATQCLVNFAKTRNISLTSIPRLHDKATAVLGKQTRKHAALIPEFHHFSFRDDADDPLPKGCKILSPHLGGEALDETEEDNDGVTKKRKRGAEKIGHYHTPKQFVSRAKNLVHPMDSTDHLEAVTREALEYNLTNSRELVEVVRKKNLLMARLLAKQLQAKEAELHNSFPECMRKVLDGKRLLLWEELLRKYEYDDMGVVDFMKHGVKLAGVHSDAPCYPRLVRPATLTEDDLRMASRWRRKAMLGKCSPNPDPSHIQHLEDTAKEEVEMGFLEGPFGSEAEVSRHLACEDWTLIRRFVLVQGAEQKLRPIDDCLEAQLNQSFTSSFYLKLQDVDYIAGLGLEIASSTHGGRQRFGSGRWLGKCLDLSKAYKQMPIDPQHRSLGVIFFHDLNGKPKFYVSNSLMFGATAAVYSFNRVSRSLWFLFNKMLAIPCGVFYDDFPLFSPAELSTNADECASELLDLLGWRHAKTGPKGLPFQPKFQVLGCCLDLSRVGEGVLVLENKPGRVERVMDNLKQFRDARSMSLHEAQVLHGLLRYACGFFAGKHLHQVCAETMAIGHSGSRKSGDEIVEYCNYALSVLESSVPRLLRVMQELRPILVFTDGAWENGSAGIGAVVVDMATGWSVVQKGKVPEDLLAKWKTLVGDHLICQIELYTMVALRWRYKEFFCNRRTLWFVDNDAARYALIKGLSPSQTMRSLVREFYSLDLQFPTFSWVERVPSFSNVADGPSRDDVTEAFEILGVSTCEEFEHPSDLVGKLLQS